MATASVFSLSFPRRPLLQIRHLLNSSIAFLSGFHHVTSALPYSSFRAVSTSGTLPFAHLKLGHPYVLHHVYPQRRTMHSESSLLTTLQHADVAGLINLINAAPTWDTINEIAYTFPFVVKEHPTEVHKLANSLRAAIISPDTLKTITSTDECGKPRQQDLRDEFNMCLYEMLTSEFSVSDEDRSWTVISPTNDFLVAAMISGALVRTDLCISSPQIGTITRGLQLPCEDWKNYIEPWQQEIYAIHGCLALLVGGVKLYKAVLHMLPQRGTTDPQDVLVAALKRVADNKVIKYETGISLLQLVIQHAEEGFSKETDVESVWHTLFSEA